MNIQAQKIELMKLILETNSPSVLESVKTIFKSHASSDFWEKLSPEQKDDILLGAEELELGEYVDYELLMKKHR